MPETPETTPTFASALVRLMASRGISQAALARGLGVWEGNVSRWRRGGGIEIENVRKIADFFGVDSAWLEALAGYSDSDLSLTKDSSETEAERQIWRARFDSLMETRVPRGAWKAYLEACDALADAYNRLWPGELNSEERQSLNGSTLKSEGPDPDAQNTNLAETSHQRRRAQQFTVVTAGV